MRLVFLATWVAAATAWTFDPQDPCTTWYELTTHNTSAFRNVKDWGAKGDGQTDDTAAIQAALTTGRSSGETTSNVMVVYLPPGNYMVSDTLPLYFYTHLVGNFQCRPTITLAASSAGFGSRKYLLEATWGDPGHVSNFYHQIHNLNVVIEDGNPGAVAVHWSVAQATSLRNLTIDVGTGDMGYFSENGGGGFIGDVEIIGGNTGMMIGGQQWTIRNLTVRNAGSVGVNVIWNWVFAFLGLNITNCPTGITFTGSATGSLALLDSSFTNVNLAIQTDFPATTRGLLLDRVLATNVPQITYGLPGNPAGAVFIPSWRQGPAYSNEAPLTGTQGVLPTVRPNKPIATQSRPWFGGPGSAPGSGPVSGGVLNVWDVGAKGDGVADDTAAVQKAVDQSDVVFFPFGTYLLSSTVTLRNNSVLVGEGLAVLMAKAGSPAFQNESNPTPMILTPAGASTSVQFADLLFSAEGDVPGCTLLQWQSGPASGLWDVHYRLEHTTWAMLHMTGSGAGYLENTWLWTADHDIDSGATINVTNPRGFLCESAGPTVMVGTASEHNYLFQYRFLGASNAVLVLTQTETPYWQSPPSAWSMTIENSSNVLVYGSGYYNWFNGNQSVVFRVENSSAVAAFATNVHGIDTLLLGNQGSSIPANYADTFCAFSMADLDA